MVLLRSKQSLKILQGFDAPGKTLSLKAHHSLVLIFQPVLPPIPDAPFIPATRGFPRPRAPRTPPGDCASALCSFVYNVLRPLHCSVNSDSSRSSLGKAPLAPRRSEWRLPAPGALQDSSAAGSHLPRRTRSGPCPAPQSGCEPLENNKKADGICWGLLCTGTIVSLTSHYCSHYYFHYYYYLTSHS